MARGTNGDDSLDGTSGDDIIRGRDGDDQIFGLDGNDQLFGQNDDDSLFGGAGDDLLDGGPGLNSLYGGTGNDTIFLDLAAPGTVAEGGDDEDHLSIGDFTGGAGNGPVTFDFTDPLVAVTLDGVTVGVASGFESFDLVASLGDDSITGGDGDDLVFVNGGSNQVFARGGDDQVAYDVSVANTLDGGDGIDRLTVDADGDEALIFRGAQGSDGRGSQLTNFEEFQVFGSTADDEIITAAGNDMISGGDGKDVVRGQGGDDLLFGGADRDTLKGDDGADALWGGPGGDKLFGGVGADSFVFDVLGDDLNRVQDFEAGVDTIEVFSFLVGGLASGTLDPALLSFDEAVGTGAQFVLVDTGANDKLLFDTNGSDNGGAFGLAIIKGESGLTADDITIV